MPWLTLHNIHAGQTGLVIGNGPSLSRTPRTLLERYPSFGTNRIFLLSGFTPNYYCAVNPLVVCQSINEIRAIGSRYKFICEAYWNQIPGAAKMESIPNEPYFHPDPRGGVYEGYTVTYVCLQLAFWMGFQQVLLVGVDHAYRFQGQPNSEVTASASDKNHFDAHYFGAGFRWHLPDLDRMRAAYQQAELAYRLAGRRIINLTPNSALDVFERDELGNW